ncbi:hypothetical protein GIB67_036597 [Kingdonia uniflora]|uniref:Agenet domain-containing protein n=1 Tax=Kingdonia uniflora TaxID=39325 RepID=A0A7J7MEF6_9MAGN|nr:hypothetical protein GIB67_036597 [Kingdonia uniflora]
MGGVKMKKKNHHQRLPFKVGQQAESKSFLEGYRGAWFRCKVKDIGSKKGYIEHKLEYIDFPDEKLSWTKLYEKSTYEKPSTVTFSREETEMQLMVRPSFPHVYSENQIPDTCKVSEVIAIVDNAWKVGDLVDWRKDDCYWTGKITQLLGEDKVQIELPEPPVGEGGSYEITCKDLRPSLDWSPEHGWTVPLSGDNGARRYCACLVQPVNQEKNNVKVAEESIKSNINDEHFQMPKSKNTVKNGDLNKGKTQLNNAITAYVPVDRSKAIDEVNPANESKDPAGGQDGDYNGISNSATRGASLESAATLVESKSTSISSHGSARSLPTVNKLSQPPTKELVNQAVDSGPLKEEIRTPLALADSEKGDNHSGNRSFSDSVSSVKHDTNSSSGSSKKFKVSSSECLNSLCSDSIESSIVELEELANKIKWLKRVHRFGIQYSNSVLPSWKFLEARASR